MVLFDSKFNFCPIPQRMKTKSHYYSIAVFLAAVLLSSCGILGKKNKGGSALSNDGQLHGVAPGNKYVLPKPPGMVYIPQGTFHMGPSDEDVAYAFSARNRSVSISGFWMDATEITNNEYRQFVYWVRDSVIAKKIGYVKADKEGNEWVDWAKMKALLHAIVKKRGLSDVYAQRLALEIAEIEKQGLQRRRKKKS